MSSPRYPAKQAGSYNPQELISDLDLYTLNGLNETTTGPWMRAIRTERLTRERSLEALRTYRPTEAEMPAYDDEDPAAYFAQARATNASPAQRSDTVAMQTEIKMVQGLAGKYLTDPNTRVRLSGITRRINPNDLAGFFAGNLFGVVGTARSVALRSFEAERNAVLRKHFPGIVLMSRAHLEYSARSLPITSAQVVAAREEVATISSYRAPYPDFFQLSDDQQTAIVRILGREWEELCLLVHADEPETLMMRTYLSTTPLAYLPTRVLREALEGNPEVNPTKLCRAFLRTPLEFQVQVASLTAAAAAATLLRAVTTRQEKKRSTKTQTHKMPESSGEHPDDTEFMQYDHALITVNERRFYLPIDQPRSLLAARVLHTLAQAGTQQDQDGLRIAKIIWKGMTPTERALFTNRKKDLERKSGVIDASVLEVLRGLTNRMGITRETSGEKFKIERQLTFSLNLAPPAEATLVTLTPIFPPGTLREKIDEFAGDIVPAETIETAGEVLRDILSSDAPLSPPAALELLSFVTDRNGKRALRIQLEANESSLSLEDALRQLHGQAKHILGEAYEGAYRNRMVAGNHATGEGPHIQQISGRLPITTKKWYIGSPR